MLPSEHPGRASESSQATSQRDQGRLVCLHFLMLVSVQVRTKLIWRCSVLGLIRVYSNPVSAGYETAIRCVSCKLRLSPQTPQEKITQNKINYDRNQLLLLTSVLHLLSISWGPCCAIWLVANRWINRLLEEATKQQLLEKPLENQWQAQ